LFLIRNAEFGIRNYGVGIRRRIKNISAFLIRNAEFRIRNHGVGIRRRIKNISAAESSAQSARERGTGAPLVPVESFENYVQIHYQN